MIKKLSPQWSLGVSVLLVVGLDQGTKWLMTISQLLGWQMVLNTGISFGWLGSLPQDVFSLVVFGFLILAVVVGWRWWLRTPVLSGMFFGGGVSNLIDRVWLGGVRDWLPIPFFPLHNNLADWAVVLGILGCIWYEGLHERVEATRN